MKNKSLISFLFPIFVYCLALFSFLGALSTVLYYGSTGYKDIHIIFLISLLILMFFLTFQISKSFSNKYYDYYYFEDNYYRIMSFIIVTSFCIVFSIYKTPYYGKDDYYNNISVHHVEIEKRIISKNYDDAIHYISKLERFDDPALIAYKKEINSLKSKEK